MAKYGKSASKTVASAMRRKKKGTLKSGSGRKVTSRKQAIAIGLSEAREKGAKVPRKSLAQVEQEEVADADTARTRSIRRRGDAALLSDASLTVSVRAGRSAEWLPACCGGIRGSPRDRP